MATELSAQNRLFAEAIMYGSSSIAEAYRDTRETTGTDKSTRNAASRLWNTVGVRAYAETLRNEIVLRQATRKAGECERIRLALWAEASAADRAADRLTALRLLGLSVNLFAADKPETATGPDAHSAAEIANDIERMLIELSPEVDADLGGAPDPPTPLLAEQASPNSKHQSTQTITNSARINTQTINNPDRIDNVIQMHPAEGVYSSEEVSSSEDVSNSEELSSSATEDFELLDSVTIFEVSPKKKKKNFEIPGMNPLKF